MACAYLGNLAIIEKNKLVNTVICSTPDEYPSTSCSSSSTPELFVSLSFVGQRSSGPHPAAEFLAVTRAHKAESGLSKNARLAIQQ